MFLLLGAGYLIAIVAFITEHIVYCKKNKRNMDETSKLPNLKVYVLSVRSLLRLQKENNSPHSQQITSSKQPIDIRKYKNFDSYDPRDNDKGFLHNRKDKTFFEENITTSLESLCKNYVNDGNHKSTVSLTWDEDCSSLHKRQKCTRVRTS